MSEFTMDRLRENLESLKMKNTLEILDNYLERAVAENLELATMRFLENGENVVFLGPPGVGKTHLASALGLVAAQHRFSTYYVNCHLLIEQLKKAHFENRLPDKLKVLAKYRMLIIDEIGYLPMDIQGANLFFQLIARRYEKISSVFTSNKTFSQWNVVFATSPLPPPSWIVFCITAPLLTSRASLTASRNAKNLCAKNSRL